MNTELRNVHANVLMDIAAEHSDIMVLEADLMGSVSTKAFAEEYPDNFVQCGIAEANMIGVAAGFSAVGKVPFVHSFGCFITRRCFDQVFLSGGYAQQHLNIFGSDAGVSAVTNGGTHMPFEDVGLMRLVPGASIIEVSDRFVLEKALHYSYSHPGVNYIRSTRKELPEIYKSTDDVEIGKGNVLKEGNDLTIVASGLCVHDALLAAESIELNTGKSVAVIDLHTIKPLDTGLIAEYAQKTKCLVTVENHNIIGGLGDAVGIALLEAGISGIRFKKLGVDEQYGQVGSLEYLKEFYGISANRIADDSCTLLAK